MEGRGQTNGNHMPLDITLAIVFLTLLRRGERLAG